MLSLATEPIEQCGEELLPLLRDCLGSASAGLPWSLPSRGQLLARERAGEITFTFRTGAGRLAGFCQARRVGRGAADGGMFIAKPHRGSSAALRMVAFVQQTMRGLGAEWFVWECDEDSGSKALAERLGHRLITRKYITNL